MPALRLLATGLLLMPWLLRPAVAQTLDPTFASPASLYAPGNVYAMGPQQADGKRVVAGTFSRINGVAARGIARLDAAGGLDAAFTQNVGNASNIYRVQGLASGQYLLGAYGGDVVAGNLTRTELLRLNADGTADAAFDPGSGPLVGPDDGTVINYAVQADGKIVVAGFFDSYSGHPAAAVVRLNADGSFDPTFNVGAGVNSATSNGEVDAVTVQPDGKILVGGYFTAFNGQAASSLVRLNTNGSVDATFTSALPANSDPLLVLVQPDGRILVSNSSGTTNSIVRLNANGSLDASFNASALPAGTSYSYFDTNVVLQPDGRILASTSLAAAGAGHVVRLTSSGALDGTFAIAAGPNEQPTTLGLQADGKVLVGGTFDQFYGTETRLGRLTGSGAADVAFAPRIHGPGAITAVIRQADGQYVAGGTFTEINGLAAHRLARFSATGILDAAYLAASATLPGPVACLGLQADGKVLAGTFRGLRRVLATGAPDAGFGSFAAPFNVAALAIQANGRLVVGGSFSGSAAGVPFSNVARLLADGSYDASFSRADNGLGSLNTVTALLLQADGRLVVAGAFGAATGSPAVHLARYEATGAVDGSFSLSPTFTTLTGANNSFNRVLALAQQADGKLLAAGNFGTVGNQPAYGVARFTTSGSPDAGFLPSAALTGSVLALAVQPNGRLLLGGSFSTGALSNLARVQANGQLDNSFGPTATPGGTVAALVVQPDGAVVLGGNFSTVGGLPAQRLARITAPNVLAVAAPAALAARTSVWPVPAHSVLYVAPDMSAAPQFVQLADALGRVLRQQTLSTTAPEAAVNVDGLAPSVYLLRVQYANGTATRAIVVE